MESTQLNRSMLVYITDVITAWVLIILFYVVLYRTAEGTYRMSGFMKIIFVIGVWNVMNKIIKFTDWNFNPKNYKQ